LAPLERSAETRMPEDECIVVLCTCPDSEAAALAETLVAERLAACVNRLPGVASSFWWNGKVQQETETLLLIKSTRERIGDIRQRIQDLHSYELPEILAVPVVGGLESYLEWVRASVAGPST
jgi:periplasmic divalent cation tolerance protein